MAVVAAARGAYPAIAGFHQRLRLAGKPVKLALTACTCKLVVTLKRHAPYRHRLAADLTPNTVVFAEERTNAVRG